MRIGNDAVFRSVEEQHRTLHVADALQVRERINRQNANLRHHARSGEERRLKDQPAHGFGRHKLDCRTGSDGKAVDDDVFGLEAARLDEPVVETVDVSVAALLVWASIRESVAGIVNRRDGVAVGAKLPDGPQRLHHVLRVAVAAQNRLLAVFRSANDRGDLNAVRPDVDISRCRLAISAPAHLGMEHDRVYASRPAPGRKRIPRS